MTTRLNLTFLALALGSACLTWVAQHHPFFWDTVQLGSKHAHHFLESQFSLPWLLPPAIDSGHPPTFGLFLALCWKWFGQTLPTSHWAIFPFLLIINFLLLKIGHQLSSSGTAWIFPLLIWADPVLASQAILVSPDIPLVAFFLLAVWGIWNRNPWMIGIAVMGLGWTSMRGMMVGIALYLWSIAREPRWSWRVLINNLWPFLPGGLTVLGWLIYHYSQMGWIGFHGGSPWSPSFQSVNAFGFGRNLAVMLWRMLDFGRVFIWLALAGIILYMNKLHLKSWLNRHPQIAQIGWLCVLLALVLAIPALCFRSLSAHRYLLPVFISLSMLLWAMLSAAPLKQGVRSLILVALIVGLACGNFWRYPEHISTGWDSTLSHWPYYEVRGGAIKYLENRQIPLQRVGTAFPEIGPLKYRDLSGRNEGFKAKNLASDAYILWSNVMNDFTDAERSELQSNWQALMTWKKGAVKVVLYAKR